MSNDDGRHRAFDRRGFVQSSVAAAIAGIGARAGIGSSLARLPHVRPRPTTPAAAIEELLAGNRRFMAEQLTSTSKDLSMLREHTAEKQKPFAGILACADSRVPVELVFDQSIGQLFVARVAGNVMTPEIIASLEYGVAALGVQAILVLGHTNCGAVKAAMKTETVPGQISALYAHLQAAVEKSGGDVAKAIALNAAQQAELLRASSTVVREATKAGTLKVVSGVYDLDSGKVALS